MSPEEIIQAWKDRRYRQRLTATKRSRLPENPAGAIEIEDGVLRSATGGTCISFNNCNIDFCLTEDNPFTLGSCCAEPPGGGPPLSVSPGQCQSGAGTSFCTCG